MMGIRNGREAGDCVIGGLAEWGGGRQPGWLEKGVELLGACPCLTEHGWRSSACRLSFEPSLPLSPTFDHVYEFKF